MNYGFVIDNRSCIGCHACSTACKSENEVPLGVSRTWVKYTETGAFPDTQRHFQVTRCNHCENPPCVRICPTAAMYQRQDGIVEFDKDACIGCKACMQACPYDAIHIDPESGTAAKCHFCAHRIEVGLEPSCAVVCPTHAIIAGDLDDPRSEIAMLLAREKVSVRKPEQGTAPKVFYIEGAAVSLVPTATDHPAETFMFADLRPSVGGAAAPETNASAPARASSGRNGGSLRAPQPQGLPVRGPLAMGGNQASHMVQVGYNQQHLIPWHWPVPAYLVTKAIAAGLFMLLAAAFALDVSPVDGLLAVVGGTVAVSMMVITTALLVYDLERPERFLYILLRPQWRSWLARGALVLIGFSTVATVWWLSEAAAHFGYLDATLTATMRPWLFALGSPLAAGTAIYTAFLFGQAEGRDLWQSPLLPVHLLVQSVLMGAAALLLLDLALDLSSELSTLARWTFGVAVTADLFLLLLGEVGMSHASEVAAQAARRITAGPHRYHFWGGAIALGHVLPLVLLAVVTLDLVPAAPSHSLAALLSIVGLYAYEHAFVMAPQEVPNS